MGDRYVLQMHFQGAWYDWDKAPSLGLEYELENPDGTISGMRDLEPVEGQDLEYWIKVSNLGHLGMDTFEFRLVGHDAKGHFHPSKATEAYLYFGDMPTNITLTDNFKVGPGKLVLLDQAVIEDDALILVKTNLEPGRLIDVHIEYPQGTYTLHSQCMVGSDGEVLVKIENTAQKEPMSPWLAGVLFALIFLCIGAGAYVMRKS